MNPKNFVINNLDTRECLSCGSNITRTTIEEDCFQYGDGDSAVNLKVSVLVHHCDKCGMSFTIDDAEQARHTAICRHLRVHTPEEIREIREQYSMSQAEFAEISKIGKASLARWESGLIFQNPANDNLLYLLSFKDNLERLKTRYSDDLLNKFEINPNYNVIKFESRFKLIKPEEAERRRAEAEAFELFPKSAVGSY